MFFNGETDLVLESGKICEFIFNEDCFEFLVGDGDGEFLFILS